MSKYDNSTLAAAVTPFAAGAVYVDQQVTDVAGDDFPTSIADGDLVQIGVVPANCVLVPHLCNIAVPILDTNGTATLKFTVGTAADTDVLVSSEKDAKAAVTLKPGDLLPATVGDPENDTPIYLVATAAAATLATSGTITADLAVRAYSAGDAA
ncbi:MAG: hypothetical protein L0H70_08565 [Xanthomonadales bacterium]|nr:hypothetical protein [Xanthomonadales bacterium]